MHAWYQKFQTDHAEYTLTPASFELVEELVALHDGPFGDSSAIPTYMVSKLAREHVTVALTGDGGDELFCGYPRFLAGEWAERIPRVLRYFGRLLGSPVSGNSDLLSRVRRFLSVASLPLADRMTAWSSFISQSDHKGALDWNRSLFEQTLGIGVLSRILAHNFESYLPYDLLVKADRASMAHGLELRSPFLDTALIEYASRLPASMLHHGRDTKWILKQAFSDLLPMEIMNRSKMGFGMPLGTWFRENLSGYLQDYLGSQQTHVYNYLDREYIQRLLSEHIRGSCDNSGKLWLLLTLEIWLRSL